MEVLFFSFSSDLSCLLWLTALWGDHNPFMRGNTVILIKNREIPDPSLFSKYFYLFSFFYT